MLGPLVLGCRIGSAIFHAMGLDQGLEHFNSCIAACDKLLEEAVQGFESNLQWVKGRSG